MVDTYIVVCRDDRLSEADPPSPYILATREVFTDWQAATAYARGVSPSREALVVSGRWHQLRLP